MRNFHLILFLLSFQSFGQKSSNITLLDHWFTDTLLSNSSQVRFNDCWGYSANGEEYAMAGSTEGCHFFHIKNDQLVPVDFVKGNYSSAGVVHRDLKTYKNFAYLVCDEGPSKLQIVDLSYLPDSVHLVAELDTDFGRVHNLYIDSVNQLLFACLVTPIVAGNPTNLIPMRVFSLSNPVNPVLLYEGPSSLNEVHDAYVRNGIAILNCGFDGLRVYDFNNPSSPQFIQNINIYQDQGYNHQGWLTPDGTRYIFGDETNGMRLKKCTVTSNHMLTIKNYFGINQSEGSVPHNIMTDNDFAFVAYYNEGFYVFDIRNFPVPVASYDTYPQENEYKLNGAWGVYSDLPSKRILVSDRENGLFLFDFNRELFKRTVDEIAVFPTLLSSGDEITVQLSAKSDPNFEVFVYNMQGQKVSYSAFSNQTYGIFSMQQSAGMYFVRVKYLDYLGDEKIVTQKVVVR